MIVTANSLASVNFVTGTWQIELGWMITSFFVLVFYANVPVQGDQGLSEQFILIGYYGLFYHTFCFCMKIGCAIQKNSNSYARAIAMLLTMLMVGLLLKTSEAVYIYTINSNYKSTYNQCMYQWCILHLYSFFSVILSYVTFMFCRSYTRQKLDPALEVPEHKRLPIVDTLLGMQFLANMFVNNTYPLFMVGFDSGTVQTAVHGAYWIDLQRKSITYVSLCSFIFTFLHVFVSWRSGPEFWKLLSPYFYVLTMIFNYIVVPCVYVPVMIIFMIDPKLEMIDDNYTSWNLIYTIMQLGNLIDWIIDGRARFMLQKDIYIGLSAISNLEKKIGYLPLDSPAREELNLELDTLKEEKFNQDKLALVPYALKPRGLGEGFVRINTKMEMSKEIYTLAFLSNLEINYIERFVDLMTAQVKNEEGNVDEDHLSQKQRDILRLLNTDPADLTPLEQNQQKLLLLQKKDIVITKRAMIFQNTQLAFCCQVMLCVLILWQILVLDVNLLDMFDQLLVVILCRFIAAINLHLALMDELVRALSFMKYAVNHPYMFRSWQLSFMTAMQQAFILCFVELICVAVVCISVAPIEIVFNFIALAIIADFDMYIYSSYSDCLKKLIDLEDPKRPVLQIMHTTSSQCKMHEKSLSEDEDGERRILRIKFMDRGWQNKVAYIVYKFCRGFFVSFYFYFTPYITLVISLGYPIHFLLTQQVT